MNIIEPPALFSEVLSMAIKHLIQGERDPLVMVDMGTFYSEVGGNFCQACLAGLVAKYGLGVSSGLEMSILLMPTHYPNTKKWRDIMYALDGIRLGSYVQDDLDKRYINPLGIENFREYMERKLRGIHCTYSFDPKRFKRYLRRVRAIYRRMERKAISLGVLV